MSGDHLKRPLIAGVRLSRDEMTALSLAADREGKTVAAFLRDCGLARAAPPARPAQGGYLRGPRRGLALDPWTREQESRPCGTCDAEPGRQCVTASGTGAPLPHLARYEEAREAQRQAGTL